MEALELPEGPAVGAAEVGGVADEVDQVDAGVEVTVRASGGRAVEHRAVVHRVQPHGRHLDLRAEVHHLFFLRLRLGPRPHRVGGQAPDRIKVLPGGQPRDDPTESRREWYVQNAPGATHSHHIGSVPRNRRLAQLARAPPLQGGGRGFEPLSAHVVCVGRGGRRLATSVRFPDSAWFAGPETENCAASGFAGDRGPRGRRPSRWVRCRTLSG